MRCLGNRLSGADLPSWNRVPSSGSPDWVDLPGDKSSLKHAVRPGPLCRLGTRGQSKGRQLCCAGGQPCARKAAALTFFDARCGRKRFLRTMTSFLALHPTRLAPGSGLWRSMIRSTRGVEDSAKPTGKVSNFLILTSVTASYCRVCVASSAANRWSPPQSSGAPSPGRSGLAGASAPAHVLLSQASVNARAGSIWRRRPRRWCCVSADSAVPHEFWWSTETIMAPHQQSPDTSPPGARLPVQRPRL